MIDYIRGLIQPLNNRYYNGNRRSLFLFCFDNFFIVAFLIFLAIVSSWIFWLITTSYIVLAAIYFIHLDPHLDKLTWKYGWKHLYKPPAQRGTDEQKLMKEYSINPSEENKKALEDILSKKQH